MVTIASLFLLLLLLNACSTAVKSPTPFNPRVVVEPSDSIEEYKISANDELEIKFFYNTELNEKVLVRPDGRISLQFANDVIAAGLTPAELTDILTEINCGRNDFSHACPRFSYFKILRIGF
jgi:protein involved in polysaccharide export with SLBB domain